MTWEIRESAEVIEVLRAHLPELRERYAVRTLGVFGAYARGEAREGSDLDLLMEFDQAPSLFTYIRLEGELSELLPSFPEYQPSRHTGTRS